MKKLVLIFSPVLLLTTWLYATEQWRFFHRAITYPKAPITNLDWYDTTKEIPGSFIAPLSKTSSSPIDKDALKEAQAYVQQTPTSSLVVLHKNKLVHESYSSEQAASQLTNSMSMAKSIIALLIGIAIDERKIKSVDDKVSDYLEHWQRDERKEISLRNLLTMSSGLRCDNDTKDYTSDLVRLHLGTDIESLASELPSAEAPGKRFEYNNLNTQILGLVLEKVTGMSIGRYMSEKLWKPIGAQSTFMWKDTEKGMERAYCCIFARAKDYARLGLLIQNQGKAQGKQVVSSKWIKMMSEASSNEPEYGLHLWRASPHGQRRMKNRKEEFIDSSMVYLDGKHKQRVYILPKYQLVIVRTGERPKSWNDAFLPNTLVRGLNKTSKDTLQ